MEKRLRDLRSARTPERLWDAIVDPEIRAKYNFGAGVHSDWSPGSKFTMMAGPDGEYLLGEGENIEVGSASPARAEHGRDVQRRGEGRRHARGSPGRSSPIGDSCRLTLTHDQMREGANDQLYGGWPMVLSGLKTWLETGELLTTPGSLMYGSVARRALYERSNNHQVTRSQPSSGLR